MMCRRDRQTLAAEAEAEGEAEAEEEAEGGCEWWPVIAWTH